MSKFKNLDVKDDGSFIVKNVRLSYPHLFRLFAFEEGQTPKFSAKFLLDKKTHAKEIDYLQEKIGELIKEKLELKKLSEDKICLRDGDEADTVKEEQVNQFVLSASDSKRPVVVDSDGSPLTEEDGKPYAGCYVHLRFTFWAQNNKWGKRINCNLLGVKFAKDGDEFASGNRPSADDMFDDDDALG